MPRYGFSEEMCVNYVHYYPRVELEVCKSDVDAKALDDYFRFANDFDGQARDMNCVLFIQCMLIKFLFKHLWLMTVTFKRVK